MQLKIHDPEAATEPAPDIDNFARLCEAAPTGTELAETMGGAIAFISLLAGLVAAFGLLVLAFRFVFWALMGA